MSYPEYEVSFTSEPAGKLCPFGHPWGVNAEVARLRSDLDAATETITAQAEVLRHTRDALTAALHKWADEQDPACPQRTETP